jgi:hypothetical protein
MLSCHPASLKGIASSMAATWHNGKNKVLEIRWFSDDPDDLLFSLPPEVLQLNELHTSKHEVWIDSTQKTQTQILRGLDRNVNVWCWLTWNKIGDSSSSRGTAYSVPREGCPQGRMAFKDYPTILLQDIIHLGCAGRFQHYKGQTEHLCHTMFVYHLLLTLSPSFYPNHKLG